MLDPNFPYAYFDNTENLVALFDFSQPGESMFRTHGSWQAATGPQLDLLDGMEIAKVDKGIIPVIDKADEDEQDLTRTDLEQYILPMDLGNE